MKKNWIIKAGTTFTDTARQFGDFDLWTRLALGLDPRDVMVFDVEGDHPLPDPSACASVVVTGAHAMVTESLPWSVLLEQWIPEVLEAEVPFMGICYGHQLLAQAMGGKVDYHPGGREIGTVQVQLLAACHEDPLLSGLPQAMMVHVVHAQSVVQLPPGAVRLACNSFEPNQAFRFGTSAWGVQFHPEYNARIMRSYIEQLADQLSAAHRDVPELLNSVTETPIAHDVLRRFAQFVRESG